MSREELLRKIAETPEVEPDEEDLIMLEMAERQRETAQRRAIRPFFLWLPNVLRRELESAARREGVGLRQYCIYKLAGK